MADYYAVLGVSKTATKDDIKKAYRKAALKTHPDRVSQDQKKAAEDSFRAVTAAYEVLADDKNRALYDKHGVFPPPATSNSTGYKPRPNQPEYKPFGSSSQPPPPFFDDGGATFHSFAFTDPFILFNMMFGQDHFPGQVPFHPGHPHSRPVRTPAPMFDPQFMQQPAMFQQQFQSFAQAGAATSFPQSTSTTSTANNTPTSTTWSETTTGSPKDNEDRGWIKESKVTKVTPTGTRETTIKKTAADGTVYITRVAGDGSIRHWISINGVEKQTDRGAPEIAPRVPLSQTQPQVPPPQPRPAAYAAAPQQQPQPSSSSRHSPSASQPVNSAYDAQAAYARGYPQAPAAVPDPLRRSASRAGHHERSASRAGHHERSASRAGHHEKAYRTTSPPPVPPKENKTTTPAPSPTGSYPFAYPQAPAAAVPQRVKSPSPRQEAGRTSEREREKDLRRNHTVPSHVLSSQAAAAPMPRPQSPHFYRTRTTSDAPSNPSPTKPTSSSATQQSRSRYDSVTGQPTRMTEEPTSYVFSDTEAARVKSASAYKPSRSSNTVPAPGPQPMSQGVPMAAPGATAPPRRSSSRYGHQHSQSMQAPGATTRHHSVPVPQPIPMPITNELGLGFVPPPSSGLGSSRNSGASVGPSQPLGKSSRNPSFEEIVYPYGSNPKSSSRSQQQQQQQQAYGGNPLPNPPMYREPWTAEAQQQQQARYRQAAA